MIFPYWGEIHPRFPTELHLTFSVHCLLAWEISCGRPGLLGPNSSRDRINPMRLYFSKLETLEDWTLENWVISIAKKGVTISLEEGQVLWSRETIEEIASKEKKRPRVCWMWSSWKRVGDNCGEVGFIVGPHLLKEENLKSREEDWWAQRRSELIRKG